VSRVCLLNTARSESDKRPVAKRSIIDSRENRMLRVIFSAITLVVLTACSSVPDMKPIEPAHSIDLPRFMGDWYVIANIPTFIEKEAYNAVERYRLEPSGRIATTFTFNNGAFDGPPKKYEPTGFVRDRSNAVWAMQFVWPIKAQYLIAYVDETYSHTIVARDKRDHVWVMARTPHIEPAIRAQLIERVRSLGYNTAELRFVPQQAR
jgi:apolipoprotein D and lipocalin family protein